MAINYDADLSAIHSHNIDPKNREIFLHSYIGDSEEEGGVDYRSAVVFEKNMRYLNSLSSTEPILIHMHLPGGDWEDCLGIYDTIQASRAKTIILAYGKVQSSSSIIFQAPNLRILMPNVTMLIHYGSISLDGEHSKAAASSVKWNERESDKMLDIFTERCMQGDMAKSKNWKKMIAKKHIQSQLASQCDWILTAKEAVEYNFADGILGDKTYPNIDSLKSTKRKNKNASRVLST
jgi:ATP-dependent protease ClpP protease subunit